MRYFKDSQDGFYRCVLDETPAHWVEISQLEYDTANALSAAEIQVAAKQLADEAAKNTAIANPVIQYLVSHTPAECISKVNSDVTDLASAKIMLGHFAVALCVLAKDKLRE